MLSGIPVQKATEVHRNKTEHKVKPLETQAKFDRRKSSVQPKEKFGPTEVQDRTDRSYKTEVRRSKTEHKTKHKIEHKAKPLETQAKFD